MDRAFGTSSMRPHHHHHHQRTEALCLVCGDKASGRHYGVSSCDGCRGFFKRSIRRNLDYVCKESNQCVVDVSRRNQCQACRFRRCLEVNMKRDAVQHERAPRGSLKRSYGPPESFALAGGGAASSSSSSSPRLQGPSLAAHPAPFYPFPWRHPNGLPAGGRPFPLTILIPPPPPPPIPTSGGQQQQPIKEDEVSSSAITLEDKPGAAAGVVDPSSTAAALLHLNLIHQHLEEQSLNDPTEAAARLLFLAVRWTRTIPSFSHLTYRDQSVLLEGSWAELFVLTIAQWGLNLDDVSVRRNCPDASEQRQDAIQEALQELRQVVGRIHLLRLDHTEFACLKALVLFRPDTRGLRDSVTVEVLQDQTQMMLQEYCASTASAGAAHSLLIRAGHQSPSNNGRFGKVLLILPALRAIQNGNLVDLFFRKLIGDTPMSRLLADLMMGTLI